MKKKLLEKDIFYLSLFICICLGRIDLEAERLNCGVLKRKTDLRGGPLI